MVGLCSVDPGGGGWLDMQYGCFSVGWLVFLFSCLSLVGAGEVGFFF